MHGATHPSKEKRKSAGSEVSMGLIDEYMREINTAVKRRDWRGLRQISREVMGDRNIGEEVRNDLSVYAQSESEMCGAPINY